MMTLEMATRVPHPRPHPPLPLRTKVSYAKRMTIAIGVLCDGGLVIGSDLQYTMGHAKFPGKKVWHICPEMKSPILISAAGNPNSANRAIRLAERNLRAECSDLTPTV